jgi:hypothetical protein
MVWGCFTDKRLGPLIVCEEGGIGADEYEDILCDSLFSLIDDLLEPPEEPEMVRVATHDTYLFMQDNAPCHTKARPYDPRPRVFHPLLSSNSTEHTLPAGMFFRMKVHYTM